MARSVQGSPFIRKVSIPESNESKLIATSTPIGVSSEISGMCEFTSPRTVRAEDASSLGDTPSLRKSTRVRKSTLLANFATVAEEVPTSSTEVNEEIKTKLTFENTEPFVENDLLKWCRSNADGQMIKKKVEQILNELESKPEETLLQILNCILAISGVRAQIEPDDLNVDDPAQVILRFLNNDKLLTSPEVTLLGKRNTKGVFKKFYELFKNIGSAGTGIDGVVGIVASDLIPWLITLSSVSLRSLRISSTVAALALLTGSCECARGLQRSAESTKRVAKRVVEVSSKVAAVEQIMQTLFDAIFVQRYRDVCEFIRMFTVEQLVCWMEAYPSVFVDNTYLRYLGWSLSDASAQVRQEAIQGLIKVYSVESSSLVSFTERFQDRIVQVIERDGQNKNRALALLDLAVSKGLVTLDLSALLVEALRSDLGGIEWKKCRNIIEATFGDSQQLLSNVTAKLDLSKWKDWEGSLLFFSSATEIMDPLTNLHASPLAVYWCIPKKREDLQELMQLEISHELYYARLATLIGEHPEMVDTEALISFAQKTASISEEAMKRLIPVIQQYRLVASLMQSLAANSKVYWRGLLALCTVCDPPQFFLPEKVDDYWIALAQIEYRRILWILKRNSTSTDARNAIEDLYRAVDIRNHFEELENAQHLQTILSIWVDLLLLAKKKLEPTPLAVTDADIDFCVKKAAHVKALHSHVGLAIAKLLLSSLITPQVALRDICALPDDFEEHEELVSLAVEHCLSIGTQSLSSKFNLVKGILQMRPAFAKALLIGLRDTLKTQTDEKALSLFVEAMSNNAPTEVWSLVGSILLKDLPDIKAKAIELRPFTAAQRKKRNAQSSVENETEEKEKSSLSSSSVPSIPASFLSSTPEEVEVENKENFSRDQSVASPMKKPKTRAQAKNQSLRQSKRKQKDLGETTVIQL